MRYILLLAGIIVWAESLVFPRIVWSYVPELESMTTLQHLCINNMQHYANLSGYTFKLVTNQNYTLLLKDWHEVANINQISHLRSDITTAALIKLKLLEQYGGIWIDSTGLLVQTLEWLQTLKNQKFVNNRIDDPQVVMFYQPNWLYDETVKRTVLKQQQLVIAPYYESWFMAVPKGSPFIKRLKQLFIDTAVSTYERVVQRMQKQGITVQDYLQDQTRFLPWAIRAVVLMRQQELSRQGPSMSRLAINDFKIAAIDATQSSSLVDEEARNHVHLITKYLAEVTILQLNLHFHYAINIREAVSYELLEALQTDYINLGHFHAAADLFCDGEAIPLRYIVQGSVLDRYLLNLSNTTVPVFKADYINHHCQGSFVEVYMLLGKYLLIGIAIGVNFYISRKALLIFKPQWGVRKKIIQFQESDL